MTTVFDHIRSVPDWLPTALGPTLDLIHTRQAAARGGDDERKRQAGLYVSVEAVDDGVTLEHPQQITAEEAAAELDQVRQMIEGLVGHHAGGLPRELWSDEEGAMKFAAFLVSCFPNAFHGVSVPRSPEKTGGDGAEQTH
jgi:hypothetical protein